MVSPASLPTDRLLEISTYLSLSFRTNDNKLLYIRQLKKGKKSTYAVCTAQRAEYLSKLTDLVNKWPDTLLSSPKK
jgi:hypothetical protein